MSSNSSESENISEEQKQKKENETEIDLQLGDVITITNPKNLIETSADKNWVRGGISTRI